VTLTLTLPLNRTLTLTLTLTLARSLTPTLTAHRFVCTKAFPPVALDQGLARLGVPLRLPRFPCRSVCDAFVNDCAGFWQLARAAGKAPPNCTERYNETLASPLAALNGLDTYPLPEARTSILPASLAGMLRRLGLPDAGGTQCSNASGMPCPASKCLTRCPPRTAVPDRFDVTGTVRLNAYEPPTASPSLVNASVSGCALVCPSPVFSEEEYLLFGVTISSLSSFGTVVSIFLVATWLTFTKKRKQRITIMFCAVR
jgi:hypothetical protein